MEEALPLLETNPQIRPKLQTLLDVGLGYIHLGQSSTTLSGGEAQRIKLAKELSGAQTGRTFYMLDEPTTGLHFEDVRKLLEVLQRLVELGNTVLVIEHNLDVIKTADWIIDLGPDGGEDGGRMVATGTPEQVMRSRKSFTAEALRKAARAGASRMSVVPSTRSICRIENHSPRRARGQGSTADFARALRTGVRYRRLLVACRGSSLPKLSAAGRCHCGGAQRNAARSSGAWAATSSSAAWRRF